MCPGHSVGDRSVAGPVVHLHVEGSVVVSGCPGRDAQVGGRRRWWWRRRRGRRRRGRRRRGRRRRGRWLRVARVVVGERAVVIRHRQLPALACLVRPAPLPRVVPPIDGENLRRRARKGRAIVRWHLELVVHEQRHVEG
eukprot:scaffold134586_cov81-Phaeocystis_antarctica.AAC.1